MISDTMAGLPLLLRHAAALAATLLLALLHSAIGSAVLRRLRVAPGPSTARRWPVAVSLGAGVMATLFFFMGVVHLLQPGTVLLTTGLMTALLHRELRAQVGDLVSALRRLTMGRSASVYLASGVVGAFSLLLVIGALAPTTDWDSLMYHLRVPQQFLDEGRLFLPRDNFHVALVGVAQMSTLPLLAVGVANGPALMQAAALLLLFVGVYGAARSAGVSREGSFVALAVLIGCPILLLVGITARVDVFLALLLLSAHLVLLDAVESTDTRNRHTLLGIAAVIIGFAVGIKPQAGAYALGLVPIGWRAAGTWRVRFAAAGLSLLVFAPWGIKNQLMVGSLAYPAAAPNWFQPWLADIFGTKVPPPTIDHAALEVLGDARLSFNILDAFLNPMNLTIEGEGYLYRMSPALLLLPLAVVGWRNPRARSLLLVAFAYALIVIVPFGRINLRYLIPALPGLALGVALAVDALLARRGETGRLLWTAAFTGIAVFPLGAAVGDRFLKSPVLLQHAAGIVPARKVWEQHPDFTVWPFAGIIETVQAQVPKDGLILLLFESRGFAFERPVLADVLLTNWAYVSQSASAENCLAGTGITHVLINTGSINYYALRGADLAELRIPELQRFIARCLERRVPMRGAELWSLRSAPRGL